MKFTDPLERGLQGFDSTLHHRSFRLVRRKVAYTRRVLSLVDIALSFNIYWLPFNSWNFAWFETLDSAAVFDRKKSKSCFWRAIMLLTVGRSKRNPFLGSKRVQTCFRFRFFADLQNRLPLRFKPPFSLDAPTPTFYSWIHFSSGINKSRVWSMPLPQEWVSPWHCLRNPIDITQFGACWHVNAMACMLLLDCCCCCLRHSSLTRYSRLPDGSFVVNW